MKMFDAANRFCRQSTWKTLAALKVCLLALGGDLGCSAGPTLAGMVSAAAGDDLKTGVLAALVFPLVLTLCVLFQHRRASAKKLSS